MVKSLASHVFRMTSSTFSVVRKLMIMTIVLFGAIYLMLFLTGETKKIDQSRMLAMHRAQIYSHIESLKADPSVEGNIKRVVYQGWMCRAVGEACTDNPKDGDKNFSGSMFGKITGWIATPYASPPASGLAWAGISLENAGFIPKTYAATGVGFASIQGYMEIWKLFRNIAYMILVVVMIVIGFMIMFRKSVGGQTVVNIESSLPRIVISLIMITFSFPIAGFFIDLMYVMIGMSISILFDAGNLSAPGALGGIMGNSYHLFGKTTAVDATASYMSATFGDLWPPGGGSFFNVGNSLWKLLPPFIQTSTHLLLIPLSITYVSSLLAPVKEVTDSFSNVSILGNGIGNLLNLIRMPQYLAGIILFMIWGPGIILGLIVVLTVLTFMFRLFFMVLSAYIKIILYIIFAPVILLFSAIPGNGNVGWWVKNLLAELSVFPTIIIIMLAGNAIMSVNMNSYEWPGLASFGGGQEIGFRLPFLYGFQPEEFGTVVSLGIILLIPDFVKLVKGVIGVSDSKLNLSMGTFFAGAGMFMGGLGTAGTIEGYKNALVGSDPSKAQKGIFHWIGLGGLAENIQKRSALPQAK